MQPDGGLAGLMLLASYSLNCLYSRLVLFSRRLVLFSHRCTGNDDSCCVVLWIQVRAYFHWHYGPTRCGVFAGYRSLQEEIPRAKADFCIKTSMQGGHRVAFALYLRVFFTSVVHAISTNRVAYSLELFPSPFFSQSLWFQFSERSGCYWTRPSTWN